LYIEISLVLSIKPIFNLFFSGIFSFILLLILLLVSKFISLITLTSPRLFKKSIDDIWVPNVVELRDHFTREGRLSTAAALKILHDVSTILEAEPNVLQLSAPVVIVGDLHGQYYDLLQVMSKQPLDTQYIFLGDYVDRGCFGTEICFLLFAMKIADAYASRKKQKDGSIALKSSKIWLLRGNHECRLLTAHFNFKRECLAKYNMEVYCAFTDVFDRLPLAALSLQTWELISVSMVVWGLH